MASLLITRYRKCVMIKKSSDQQRLCDWLIASDNKDRGSKAAPLKGTRVVSFSHSFFDFKDMSYTIDILRARGKCIHFCVIICPYIIHLRYMSVSTRAETHTGSRDVGGWRFRWIPSRPLVWRLIWQLFFVKRPPPLPPIDVGRKMF